MNHQTEETSISEGVTRRNFLGVGSAALAVGAIAGITAHAQEREDTRKALVGHSFSNPGQENKTLLAENPNSNIPPPTDHGDMRPIW